MLGSDYTLRGGRMASVCIRLLITALAVFALFPPTTAQPSALQLHQVPPLQVLQNAPSARLVDLWQYVGAEERSQALLFSLVAPPRLPNAGGVDLTLEENRYLVAEPSLNWTGEEVWTIEVTDGQRVDYVRVPVTVASSQAGLLIEVERSSRIVTTGEWLGSSHQGAEFLVSNKPGDRLELDFEGTNLVARVFTGVLLQTARYYEGRYGDDSRYAFVADWKAYRQGSARVLIDGTPNTTLRLGAPLPDGWNEVSLAADLEPEHHQLTLVVVEGYVSIDHLRVASSPLSQVEIDVSDPFGTPLSDVLLTFSRPGHPDIVLRTDHEGRTGSFYGLPTGTYEVTVVPDSNPGYLRGHSVEEHIQPLHRAGLVVEARSRQQLHFELAYSKPTLRSVSLIQRPRGTVPTLARPGDTMVVDCRTDRPLSGLELTLSNQLHARALEVLHQQTVQSDAERGATPRLRIVTRIPADTPAGLWDLRLETSGAEDVATRAVSIRSERRSGYRFVQISDLHIRDSATNHEHAEQLLDLMDEIRLLDPEFVVMTGDLTDSGSRPEYLRLLDVLDRFELPTYAIPGNHDHYSWWTRYLYRGGEEYRRFLGPGYYAFDFGVDRYIVVDTGAYERLHDRRLPGAYDDQWTWLKQRLAEGANSAGMTTVLAHYDYTSNLPRRFPVSHQLIDVLRKEGVDNFIHGHLHRSFETPGRPRVIATGSTIKGEFRLFEVEESAIARTIVLKAGDLKVDRREVTEGSSSSCGAEVTNSTSRAFAGLTFRCLLPASTTGYHVEGGSIESVDQADDGANALLVVTFDLPANSSRRVRVTTGGRRPSIR